MRESVSFFIAANQDGYQDLWVTAGTNETTVQLTHYTENRYYQGITGISAFNETLFYVFGDSIWTSDGTPQGTVSVVAPIDMNLSGIVVFGTSMLVVGTDGEHGTEFRTVDIGSSTVNLLKDIQPGIASSLFLSGTGYNASPLNERFVFLANDGIHGYEIWTTDGTSIGTKFLVGLHPGTGDSNPNSIVPVNGELLFLSLPYIPYRPSQGLSLWSTDSANHSLVPQGRATGIGNFEGNVYYQKPAPDGSAQRTYLWNGEAGVPVAGSPPDISTISPTLRLAGGDYFFGTTSVNSAYQLRKSNGESSSSTVVKEFYYVSQSYLISDGIVYFIAIDASQNSPRLWKSDGTSEGTFSLSETTVGVFSGYESQFLVVGDNVLLRHPLDLIVTDGTLLRTETVKDWIPNAISVAALQLLNGKLLVSVNDTLGRSSLWTTDGTKDGTFLVTDGFYGFLPVSGNISDAVLFVAQSAETSYHSALWRSDGTNAGTQIVRTIGDTHNVFENLRTVGNKVLFTILNNATGARTIWISDGTNEGTLPIRLSLDSNLVLNSTPQFTMYNDGIAFVAATEATGYELFRIDTTIPVTAPTALTVTNTATSTQIAWPDVVGAIQYDLWINNLSNPSAAPVKMRVNDPQYLVGSELANGAYRFWVRSLPVLGNPSAWSVAKDFTVGADPVLIATPSATTDVRPTFKWVGPSDVVSYEIWLTNRDTQTRVLYSTGLTSTSFHVDPTLTPARYAVWVRATL